MNHANAVRNYYEDLKFLFIVFLFSSTRWRSAASKLREISHSDVSFKNYETRIYRRRSRSRRMRRGTQEPSSPEPLGTATVPPRFSFASSSEDRLPEMDSYLRHEYTLSSKTFALEAIAGCVRTPRSQAPKQPHRLPSHTYPSPCLAPLLTKTRIELEKESRA